MQQQKFKKTWNIIVCTHTCKNNEIKITQFEKENFTYFNEDSIATESNLKVNQTKQMQNIIESSHIHKDNQFEKHIEK